MLTILGPTACGKTNLAVEIADKLNGEIISADSRQVYRGMDIGTGKDLDEYSLEEKTIPYHLIDICNPGEEYNVFRFQQDFLQAYNEIISRERIPILCGGTGLYIESVLKGYQLQNVPANKNLRKKLELKTDEELINLLSIYRELHNTTDTTDRERLIRAIEIETFQKDFPSKKFPEIPNIIFGIEYERETVRRRITERLSQRLSSGMIEEVDNLIKQGVNPESLIKYGLEYKYVTLYLQNKLTYEEMFKLLNIAIHQFSKRQMTWFRKMEKNGFLIHWIDGKWGNDKKVKFILSQIKKGA